MAFGWLSISNVLGHMGIEKQPISSINFVRFLSAQGGIDVVEGGWYACFISINIFCPIEMLHSFFGWVFESSVEGWWLHWIHYKCHLHHS